MAKAAKAQEKRGRGRPSSYRPEYAEQARKYALLGATDVEQANFFGVAQSTYEKWKTDHPEFSEALKAGKEVADAQVSERLYARAIGYSNPHAVKIFMPAGAEEPVYAPFTEYYPPDTTAQIFWLKNRQRGKWRDRQDHEIGGKDGGPIKTESAVVLDASKLDEEARAVLREALKAAKG